MNLLERDTSTIARVAAVAISDGEVTIELSGTAIEGAKLTFPARALKPMATATNEQLADVEVIHDGALLYWRALDIEFKPSKLIELVTGVQTAASAGAKGGKGVSEAKLAAIRANGAKGGRPRKNPPAEV